MRSADLQVGPTLYGSHRTTQSPRRCAVAHRDRAHRRDDGVVFRFHSSRRVRETPAWTDRRARLEPGNSSWRARDRRCVGADLDLRALGQHALRCGDRRAPGPVVTGIFFFVFIALSLGVTYVAALRTRSAD